MQRELTDQLKELVGVAKERGFAEAAALLERLARHEVFVLRPGEGGAAFFDPVEDVVHRGMRRH